MKQLESSQFKIKKNAKGKVEKYKARLIAKGYKQQHEVDYDEMFASIVRMKTIHLLISLVAQMGWRIFQLDVKSAFLNGYFEENVYIEQPMEYIVKKEVELVHVKAQDQVTDIFTKPLKLEDFRRLKARLGVSNFL
ncbi:hypothetical protein CR513_23320, partial [Mucuna pruriens]